MVMNGLKQRTFDLLSQLTNKLWLLFLVLLPMLVCLGEMNVIVNVEYFVNHVHASSYL